MKLLALKQDFDRCGILPEIRRVPFNQWRQLPSACGLYSIWQGDLCIYVGQGGGRTGIRGRFHHHWNKAFAIEQAGTSHGRGWVANRQQPLWLPDTWQVEYFACSRAVHRTYLEGAMMLQFDPLCNDESFEDRCYNSDIATHTGVEDAQANQS